MDKLEQNISKGKGTLKAVVVANNEVPKILNLACTQKLKNLFRAEKEKKFWSCFYFKAMNLRVSFTRVSLMGWILMRHRSLMK